MMGVPIDYETYQEDLREARREERKKCCKVLCIYCDAGNVPSLDKYSHGHAWLHHFGPGRTLEHCKAAMIWAMKEE
jgi:hypothetical protein